MTTITIDITRLGLQLAYEKVSGTAATYKALTAAFRAAINDDNAMLEVFKAQDTILNDWRTSGKI